MNVLVIGADVIQRSEICEVLSQHGMSVSEAEAAASKAELSEYLYDLVVLDISNEPDRSIELLKQLDGFRNIVVVAGEELAEKYVVTALESGADDFVARPFGKSEFAARIRVLLRESEAARQPRRISGTLQLGRFTLQPRTRSLHLNIGPPILLTHREFDVMRVMLDNPGLVLSRGDIVSKTRLAGDRLDARSVDVIVLRLRQKLRLHPDGQNLIRTVRGQGYLLEDPDPGVIA